MANTVTVVGSMVYVALDGTTALDMATYFPYGMRLAAITFRGSQATDKLVLRDSIVTGTIWHEQGDETGMGKRVPFERTQRVSPYMKVADCVFGNYASLAPLIIFELA